MSVRVRRFAPAEFEGPPQLRPANDPLDRSRSLALHWLNHYSQFIQSTRFVCGILYERFQPGGLAQSSIGLSSGFSGEGDYIMNCRSMEAQVPAYDGQNNCNVAICMTAAQDVGRFVTKAIDLQQWPAELRMCGHRVLVKDLVATVSRLKGNFPPGYLSEYAHNSRRPGLRSNRLAQSSFAPVRIRTRRRPTRPCQRYADTDTHRNGQRPIRLHTAKSQSSVPRHPPDIIPRLVRREVEQATIGSTPWMQPRRPRGVEHPLSDL